jgi:hypothetical protein
VNLVYKFLFDKFSSSFHLGAVKAMLLGKRWDSLAPLKIIVLSWQLLQHRLTTRGNLFWRGGLVGEDHQECPWCMGEEETKTHIFIKWKFASVN